MSDNMDDVNDDTSKVTADSDTDNNDNTDDSAQDSDDVEQLKQQNKRLFERAKKAEGFTQDKDGQWVKKPKPVNTQVSQTAKTEAAKTESQLSSYDTIALIDSKVTVKEDIDEVMDYAKLKGIAISEALKSSVVKTILKEKSEQRATAQATSTGSSKRVTTKISDETLLEKASKGELPESDEDMVRLAEARMNEKKSRTKR